MNKNYEDEHEASVAYAASANYEGSVAALGISGAFYAGALQEGSASQEALIFAFVAGLSWNAARVASLREAVGA